MYNTYLVVHSSKTTEALLPRFTQPAARCLPSGLRRVTERARQRGAVSLFPGHGVKSRDRVSVDNISLPRVSDPDVVRWILARRDDPDCRSPFVLCLLHG